MIVDTFINMFGCKFDEEMLLRALTHTSFCNEKGGEHYQRLELLGDAVLALCLLEKLYLLDPTMSEGELSRMKAGLVCEGFLAEIARHFKLGEYLRLGKGGEKEGLRNNSSVLADIVESVIGAAFLAGGYDNAKQIVTVLYEGRLHLSDNDWKSQLNQRLGSYREYPVYELVSSVGPDHNKVFTFQIRFRDNILGVGSAGTKKEAQQRAASDALSRLEEVQPLA